MFRSLPWKGIPAYLVLAALGVFLLSHGNTFCFGALTEESPARDALLASIFTIGNYSEPEPEQGRTGQKAFIPVRTGAMRFIAPPGFALSAFYKATFFGNLKIKVSGVKTEMFLRLLT